MFSGKVNFSAFITPIWLILNWNLRLLIDVPMVCHSSRILKSYTYINTSNIVVNLHKSFIKNKNNKGPRTEPWKTPTFQQLIHTYTIEIIS